MSEEQVSPDERMPAIDSERPGGSGRLAFQVAAGVVMAVLLLVFVIQPAAARGGVGEIVIIFGIFLAVIVVERWLRTR